MTIDLKEKMHRNQVSNFRDDAPDRTDVVDPTLILSQEIKQEVINQELKLKELKAQREIWKKIILNIMYS